MCVHTDNKNRMFPAPTRIFFTCIHMHICKCVYVMCMYSHVHICHMLLHTSVYIIVYHMCVRKQHQQSNSRSVHVHVYVHLFVKMCTHVFSIYIYQFVECFPKYMHDYTYYTCMLHYTVPCVCEKLIFVSYCILPEKIFSYISYFHDIYMFNHTYYSCVT